MSDTNLYINDLIHRYSGYTFNETSPNEGESIYRVSFHSGSGKVAEAKGLSFLDCYQKIRKDVLDGESPAFLSTTTERDALTNIHMGFPIFNVTTDRNESYNGSTWNSAAGSDVAQGVAFGEMDQYNDSGFTIGVDWIDAEADVVDANGNVTFVEDDVDGDYLLIGDDGGGTYRVEFLSYLINSTGNPVTVQVYKNGTAIGALKETINTSSTDYKAFDDWEDMVLQADDKLRLSHTTSSGTITATQVKLEIERID